MLEGGKIKGKTNGEPVFSYRHANAVLVYKLDTPLKPVCVGDI